MKYGFIAILIITLMGFTIAHAQSVVDKANYKVNRASATMDKAEATASEAGNAIKKIGSLFGKKKDKKNKASADKGDYNTLFNIKGISLSDLKALNTNVKACKNVSETKMKYSGAGVSKIYVAHKGSTEDLLTAVQKNAKKIFTDKNIENLDDGVIDISLKPANDSGDDK